VKSQPEEELDLRWRLGLPQFLGPKKCGGPREEGAVRGGAGILSIRGPSPSELVSDTRREGHRA